MAYINLWIAFSDTGLTEYKARLADPEGYTGPLDLTTFNYINRMADGERVQGMFNTPNIGGKVYTMFSLYMEGGPMVQAALDDLAAKWNNHFVIVGAWYADGEKNGLQAGTDWELDVDGNRTGNTTGTPLYPVHAQAWQIMPDLVVYDENGDVVSTTPATSNADLRDINVLQGQELRRFT